MIIGEVNQMGVAIAIGICVAALLGLSIPVACVALRHHALTMDRGGTLAMSGLFLNVRT